MMRRFFTAKNIFLFIYILCIIVLIVESLMPGKISSQQSNAVGNGVADIINDYKDDQTKVVKVEKVEITNKISHINVGDEYKLETLVTPNNATYKSLSFQSSNPEIASVSSEGVISFQKPGEVDILVRSTKYEELTDSFSISVDEVFTESISSTINALANDGVYTLYLGNEYLITNTILPLNTTNKRITYELSDNEFLSITNDIITPLKNSLDKIITITVKSNDKITDLKVIVTQENIIDLKDITIETSSIYLTQEKRLEVSLNPINATFDDYILSSNDSSIIKIKGNNIIGCGVGSAIIKVQSSVYPDIFAEKEIEVLPRPRADLENVKVSIKNNIYVGKQEQIVIKKYPSYALDLTVTYDSQNEEIARIESGRVIGINPGNTTIKVTIDNGEDSKEFLLNIEILNVEDTTTTDFELSIDELFLFVNDSYDLNNIQITSWYPNLPKNQDVEYFLSGGYGKIEDSLKIPSPGCYDLYVYHKESGISKVIKVQALYEYEVSLNPDTKINVGDTFTFTIDDKSEGIQKYDIKLSNEKISFNQNTFEIFALEKGECELIITPIIDNSLYEKYQRIYKIVLIEEYTKSLDYLVYINNEEIEMSKDELHLYINEKCQIVPVIGKEATISKIRYQSSNAPVAFVDSAGNLSFRTIGDACITIIEEYSGLSKEINISVRNYIELSDEAYTIKSQGITKESDVFQIINGHSATISFNFSKNTTYRNVSYSISDDKIAEVGDDGVITPKKAGQATIHCTMDDGFEHHEFDIKIKVLRQNFIEKNNDFFFKVRKSIGHFGAFLVLGFFSTFAWFYIFKKRKIYLSIPISMALGFIIAGMTEFIQYFVPGRTGIFDDVLLDYYGFLSSSLVLSIIIIVIIVIKKYWLNGIKKS